MPDLLPDRLLAGMICRHAEDHELIERHLVLGIGRKQGQAGGGELQALANNLWRDEKPCRDLIDRKPFVIGQRPKGPELVERMKTGAHHILGKRILDLDAGGFHKARDQMIRLMRPSACSFLRAARRRPPA